MTSNPLNDVLSMISSVTNDGEIPIVVFDLDSTLLRSGHRHLAILRDFVGATAVRSGASWDQLRELVPTLSPADFGYNISDPLIRAGINDKSQRHDLGRFWSKRYFTSAFCLHDEPAPGAVTYAQAVHDAGALVWYLTGRPHASMLEGTTENLGRHGFPLGGPRTRLELRPARFSGDKGFKVVAAEAITKVGPVVAQFENEPANANAMLPIFPDALHFIVGHVHSSAPDRPHPSLIPIDDFVLR